LAPDGVVDGSFDPVIEGTNSQGLLSVVPDNDGRVLICGLFETVDGVPRRNIARLLANGELDISFSAGDLLASDPPDSIVLQEDGRILLGGFYYQDTGGIFRLQEDGSLDSSFSMRPSRWSHPIQMEVLGNSFLVVGGQFRGIDGIDQKNLAILRLG